MHEQLLKQLKQITEEEQEILKEFEYQIPLEVHLIKKLFGGTILKIFR